MRFCVGVHEAAPDQRSRHAHIARVQHQAAHFCSTTRNMQYATHNSQFTKEGNHFRKMSHQEEQLSQGAKETLKLIRALRQLPETNGTVIAEKKALESLRISELKIVALILAEEEGAIR